MNPFIPRESTKSTRPVSTITVAITVAALIAFAAPALALDNPNILSEADKQAILDFHNDVRTQTARGLTPGQPSASNMNYLLWDEALAEVATDWASQCLFQHNANRSVEISLLGALARFPVASAPYLGENLFATSVTPSAVGDLLAGAQLWFDEFLDYTYGSIPDTCTGFTCGHYTQMVWADTRYLGCGYSHCPSGVTGFPPGRLVLVCNYYPGGNFLGQTPYDLGTPCTTCSAETASMCTHDLCNGCDGGDPLQCVDLPSSTPNPRLIPMLTPVALVGLVVVFAGLGAYSRRRLRDATH